MKNLAVTILIISGIFYSTALHGQKIKAAGFHNVDIAEKLCGRVHQNHMGIQEASQTIAEILDVVNLKYNGRILECNNFGGKVCAFIEDGVRWIAYDADLMEQAASDNWSAKGILAHELAHHLLNHSLSNPGNLRLSRADELDADDWAGYILGKLGASLDESLLFLNTVDHPSCEMERYQTHPCKSKRIADVTKGWQKAKSERPKEIPVEVIKEVNLDDRDGDGISNEVDKCPDEYGSISNSGCPYHETKRETKKAEKASKKSKIGGYRGNRQMLVSAHMNEVKSNAKSEWIANVKNNEELELNPVSNKYWNKGVFAIEGVKKSLLYEKSLSWINTNYSGSSSVIISDEMTGAIIAYGCGNFDSQMFFKKNACYFHTIILEFKDESFRYTYTDFSFYSKSSGDIPFELENVIGRKNMRRAASANIKSGMDDLIRFIKM